MAATTAIVGLLVLPILSLAYDANIPVLCDAELNLFCPPSTSCCPTFKSKLEPDVIVNFSCLISWSTRFPQGPCCPHFQEDDGDITINTSWAGGTGCAAGYECASSLPSPDFIPSLYESGRRNTHTVTENNNICHINSTARPIDNQGHPIHNKYESMPRYRACESFARDGVDVYGLPIPVSAAVAYKNSDSSMPQNDLKEQYNIGQLAYYSNMGQITADDRMDYSDITTAIIGVHGSGRDAGTYLCALTAIVADVSKDQIFTAKNQRRPLPEDVLVVAPWFMAPEDNAPPTTTSYLPYIQWDDQYPIPHTFRYGAESIPDTKHNMTISSFGAMDVLLERLCDRTHFSNLRRIVVVGHSAGGQFVQRWSLSSNSWCFGGGQFDHRWAPKIDLPNVRVVVANPRSFAYLDNRRYLSLSDEAHANDDDEINPADNAGSLTPFDKYQLRPPSAVEEDDCNEFNKYEWGLEDNEAVPAPYVINNVQKLIDQSDNTELFCRYASRDIVYLSGQRDIETLGSQICGRGKEDGYQGPSRRERSERFFAALQFRGEEVEFCGRSDGGNSQVHDRHVVKLVGHDHGLIFQSPEGIHAMFG